jgi:hypothetical protein
MYMRLKGMLLSAVINAGIVEESRSGAGLARQSDGQEDRESTAKGVLNAAWS